MSEGSIKIYLVDDHPVVRRGLCQFLDSREGCSVCGEAGDAASAEADLGTVRPDICIVDINLKGTSGIDLIKSIKTRYPWIRVIVLSMHDENEYIERAMRAGSRGYVLKNDSEDMVVEAINTVMSGKTFLSPVIRDKMLESMMWQHPGTGEKSLVANLTDREFEIFQLIGSGANTREIAGTLSLSTSTVGTYRERIKTKLNIQTPNELVKFAVQWAINNGPDKAENEENN